VATLSHLDGLVSKLKYAVPTLAILLLSGFFWLKEHDQKVAWKALANARADSIEAQDARTQDLWKVIKSMDSTYSLVLIRHKKSMIQMRDSVKTLDSEIDQLARELNKELPESGRAKLDKLVSNCAKQVNLVSSSLTACESLRIESEKNSARKDTVMLALTKSRDGYKQLWEESDEPSPSPWATVGKVETAAGILALVTKLFGLW
jgi:hypothetical protein